MLTAAIEDSDLTYLFRGFIWLLSQPLFWAALGIVVGPYLFYRGFRLLQRKRLILDTPRSTVRAAAVGAVEISGKAVGPYTLVSPLTQRDCLYYRVVVRGVRQAVAAQTNYWWDFEVAWLAFIAGFTRQKFRKSTGQIIDEVCAPLFVDDGTGELMIYPQGAEMQLTGFAAEDAGEERLARILSRHGFARDDLQAAEEYCIVPGDNIFVMGTLRENPWPTRNPGDSSLSRIGPGFVSLDEADLLRREAFPCLNPNLPSGAAQAREFSLYPPAILMQGQNPFVISTRSQREVVSELAWKSFLFIWGGPLWALWALWEILGHSEIWGVLARSPK
jgi:hypothetical protein